MNYVRIAWKHQHPEEPVLLYSELDTHRWEVRKVEIFRNGRFGYASGEVACGGTKLGEVPLPELSEIANDPQFEPVEITQDEFEAVWAQRESQP